MCDLKGSLWNLHLIHTHRKKHNTNTTDALSISNIAGRCVLKDVSNTVYTLSLLIKCVYYYSICYVGLFSLCLLLRFMVMDEEIHQKCDYQKSL